MTDESPEEFIARAGIREVPPPPNAKKLNGGADDAAEPWHGNGSGSAKHESAPSTSSVSFVSALGTLFLGVSGASRSLCLTGCRRCRHLNQTTSRQPYDCGRLILPSGCSVRWISSVRQPSSRSAPQSAGAFVCGLSGKPTGQKRLTYGGSSLVALGP